MEEDEIGKKTQKFFSKVKFDSNWWIMFGIITALTALSFMLGYCVGKGYFPVQ